MRKAIKGDKKKRVTRRQMKEQRKHGKKPKIEREYLAVFPPQTLPFQGISDEDSLEQPSALKYVETTTAPCVRSQLSNSMAHC